MRFYLGFFLLLSFVFIPAQASAEEPLGASKRLAYLVSDIRIPFWAIMARGIQHSAASQGFSVEVMSADNTAKLELENSVKAIRRKVDGIILSPTNSSAGATLLKLAAQAKIPVVVADIGADSGSYVSYISSDNAEGAYLIGRILAERMHDLGWQDGRVGIIAIPQKRENGQARTSGFMRALEEAGIKGADLRQQVDFSHQETYRFSRELIQAHADLRALWLQGSDRYQAALEAIRDSGKEGQILLICFDAEPEFLDLIPQGALVGAAMQQPFLMGQMAVESLQRHLQGEPVERLQQLPILAVSADNIDQQLPLIRRNVLGLLP
ncbi:MAG: substrate-binding domain-containing protein [Gammaproteobacteria bacterium]|nr:substrate-binding domain-containing protein [Gammaproteobacteria bacterium]